MSGGGPLRRGGRRDAGILAPVDGAVTDWAFRVVATTYVAFSLLDCLTTAYALSHGGSERNPIAASLYRGHGIGALFLLKALVVAAILLALRLMPRRVAVWVGTAFAAAVAGVVAANLGAIASR